MRVIFYAACTLLLTTGLAPAADLEAIRNAAWDADSEWTAARRTWKAEQETLTQGRSALLPSVTASYRDTDSEFDPATVGGTDNFENTTLMVEARQPLFRPGAWFGYQQAQAAVSRAEAQFRQARQNFYLRVAEQYLGVLRAWENLVSARSEEKAISRQLEQTRNRFDVGVVPRTDVEEAQAAHDLSRSRLIGTKSEFLIARDKLEALTGKRWQELAVLGEDLPLNGPQPAEPSKWVERARAQNPQVQASESGAEAARQNARQRLAGQLPTVDLIGSWQDADQTQAFTQGGKINTLPSEAKTTTYGFEIRMPLFQGGALNSQRKEAALRHEAARAQYKRTHRDAGQQARSLYRRVNSDALRVKARRQAIRSAESALEATQSGYEVGTRNVVDVLNAQQNLYGARRDYANARLDYILNSLRLKATAGMLKEQSLARINGWLSTEETLDLYSVGQKEATDETTR